MGREKQQDGTKIAEKTRQRAVSPPMFKVLMHNDDYTSMEFVVQMLEQVFSKPNAEANRIMLNIHLRGVGICGVFTYEIAETKVARVHALARKEGFPLRCSLEQA